MATPASRLTRKASPARRPNSRPPDAKRYIVRKITGTTADRPQLKKLVAALAHGLLSSRPLTDCPVTRPIFSTLPATCSGSGLAYDHWQSRSSTPRPILRRSSLPSSALRRSWNTAASRNAQHEPRRREGEGRKIRAQAEAHPAPAARSDQAAGRGRRNAALDRAQLQCQRADDFKAGGTGNGDPILQRTGTWHLSSNFRSRRRPHLGRLGDANQSACHRRQLRCWISR